MKINQINKNNSNKLTLNFLARLHDDKNDDKLAKYIKIISRSKPKEFYNLISGYVREIKVHYSYMDRQLAEFFSERLGIKIIPSTIWGWCGGKFEGKNIGIPIKSLYIILKEYCLISKQDIDMISNSILTLADTVVLRGGIKTNLIKQIDEDLSYLVGFITGDGCCPYVFRDSKKDYRDYKITISKEDKNCIYRVSNMINDLFGVETKPFKNRHEPNLWQLYFKSKYAYRLMTRIFELPEGKKAKIVKMPKLIKQYSEKNKLAFIKGLVDSDGCIHIYRHMTRKKSGKVYHYSRLKLQLRLRSKKLIHDITEVLRKLDYHVNEFSYMGTSFNRKKKIKFYGLTLISKDAERYAIEVGSYNQHKLNVIKEFFSKFPLPN